MLIVGARALVTLSGMGSADTAGPRRSTIPPSSKWFARRRLPRRRLPRPRTDRKASAGPSNLP